MNDPSVARSSGFPQSSNSLMELPHSFTLKLSGDEGAVAVVITVSLWALVMVAALVVDLGFALASRHHLQNLVDAAALAGAGQLGRLYQGAGGSFQTTPSAADRALVRAAVTDIAMKNRESTGLTGVTLSEIRLGRWNPATRTISSDQTAPDAVFVRAQGVMPTFLAGAIGFRQLSLSASAGAALSPMAEVPPGALVLPVGIASAWMAQGSIDGRRIRLYAPGGGDPCTGWTTFTETPPSIGRLQSILQALARRSYTSPAAVAGRTNFMFVPGHPTAIGPALMDLFQTRTGAARGRRTAAERGREGERDHEGEHERDHEGEHERDHKGEHERDHEGEHEREHERERERHDSSLSQWTVTVPVYRQSSCAAPSGALPVAGFATAVITVIRTPAGPVLEAVMRTGVVQRGRGGGTDYGTKGSIPGLVL